MLIASKLWKSIDIDFCFSLATAIAVTEALSMAIAMVVGSGSWIPRELPADGGELDFSTTTVSTLRLHSQQHMDVSSGCVIAAVTKTVNTTTDA